MRDLGKALSDQLVAAGPEKRFAASANELCANAIPFPLCLPLCDIAELDRGCFQRMRQKEWIGLSRRRNEFAAIEQRTIVLGARRPASSETLRHHFGIDAGDVCQRSNHQLPRDPYSKAAGDQLVPQQAARSVQLGPVLR
jgi:hypothetical protein